MRIFCLVLVWCMAAACAWAQAITEGGANEFGRFRFAPPQRFVPIDEPKFISPAEYKLDDNEAIIGLEINGDARAYPIRQMAYHHVANDVVDGKNLAVTYCIMANTAVVYERETPQERLCVGGLMGGVLVLRRQETNKLWPQIAMVPVPDNATSETLSQGPRAVVSNWGLWRKMHPATKVLAPVEEFEFYYEAYDRKPKGFNANPIMNDSIVNHDARLAPGTEVYGIARGQVACAVPLDVLRARKSVSMKFGQDEVMVKWNDALQTGEVEDSFDGYALRSYWYGWSSFYPGTELVNEGGAAGQ